MRAYQRGISIQIKALSGHKQQEAKHDSAAAEWEDGRETKRRRVSEGPCSWGEWARIGPCMNTHTLFRCWINYISVSAYISMCIDNFMSLNSKHTVFCFAALYEYQFELDGVKTQKHQFGFL